MNFPVKLQCFENSSSGKLSIFGSAINGTLERPNAAKRKSNAGWRRILLMTVLSFLIPCTHPLLSHKKRIRRRRLESKLSKVRLVNIRKNVGWKMKIIIFMFLPLFRRFPKILPREKNSRFPS